MKLTLALPATPCEDWRQARQVGVEGAVLNFYDAFVQDPAVGPSSILKKTISDLRDYDLDLIVVEGDPVPLHETKLGLPGRDREIDRYLDVVKAVGDEGVRVMCPNFMAGVNWVRTSTAVPTRGGALTTSFRSADLEEKLVDTGGAELTESRLWDNLYHFMDRVLPVAEGSGVKLALHPDDPPISPIYNVPRILTSPGAYHRLFDAFPSDSNGVCFCQANFKLMGGDVYEMAESFGRLGKIFFVHMRDVKGDKHDFEETFHDDGPTDMARMMEIYLRYAPGVPVRPDHVPTIAGDDNANFGYTMRGRLHAIGYLQGLIDGVGRNDRLDIAPSVRGVTN